VTAPAARSGGGRYGQSSSSRNAAELMQ
jgi:hypothetical protein